MTTQAAEPGFLESLLAVTAPKTPTFWVELAPGYEAEFKVVTDYTETIQHRTAGGKFAESFPAMAKQEDWKEFAGALPVTLGLASYLARTCVSTRRWRLFNPPPKEDAAPKGEWVPGPPLDVRAFLSIAKSRSNVFDDLRDKVNDGQYAIVEKAEDAAINEAKNESSETPGGTTA